MSTRPSRDTDLTVDAVELDAPDESRPTPPHIDAELPIAHQRSTAEESQLNESEMFPRRDPPRHGPQQARHNSALWQVFQPG
jgi:hypothetical protein